MRGALCLLALLVFGCDDVEVAARATNVLEHGIVQARIECLGIPANSGAWPTSFKIQKLQDGSTITTGNFTHGGPILTTFCARDEACAQVVAVGVAPGTSVHPLVCPFASIDSVRVDDDTLEYCLDNIGVYETFSTATYCTGFNLEAFGVEP